MKELLLIVTSTHIRINKRLQLVRVNRKMMAIMLKVQQEHYCYISTPV